MSDTWQSQAAISAEEVIIERPSNHHTPRYQDSHPRIVHTDSSIDTRHVIFDEVLDGGGNKQENSMSKHIFASAHLSGKLSPGVGVSVVGAERDAHLQNMGGRTQTIKQLNRTCVLSEGQHMGERARGQEDPDHQRISRALPAPCLD